jgi:hypothetical protein
MPVMSVAETTVRDSTSMLRSDSLGASAVPESVMSTPDTTRHDTLR